MPGLRCQAPLQELTSTPGRTLWASILCGLHWRMLCATKRLPVLDVVITPARDASGNLGELVLVFSVQLHHQRVLLSSPDLVLLDAWVNVVVVPLAALLGRASWHHLSNLGPPETESAVAWHVRCRVVD